MKSLEKQELIGSKKIRLKYITSQLNLVDGFNKYLSNKTIDRFRNSLLMKARERTPTII